MSTSDSRTTTSSRLSQFGLYRTIDARTEEFLRLSRKRQIRQGCACAAVSTAITVTVVVTVLLVYEYNISPNTNSTRKYAKKPNWLGFLNDSTIEGNFNKANVNIDPATIKLLPLLLKVLNHNSYLANVLEEPAHKVASNGKETTEFPYERNVFTDPKKRIKNSKMFNTEYKTPTLVQIPSRIYPTTDEYAKAKKLREYQIMLTYFDKLLNAATLSPNGEILREKQNKEKSTTTTSRTVLGNLEQPLKINFNLQDTEDSASSMTPQNASTNKNCKCKEKLQELFKKFLKGLQELMPELFLEQIISNEKGTTKISENVTKVDDFLNSIPSATSTTVITETTANTISTTQSTTSNDNLTQQDLNSNNIMLTSIKLANFVQETERHASEKSITTKQNKFNLAKIKPVTFRPINVIKYLQDHHITQAPDTKNKPSEEIDLNDFISKNIFKPRQNKMEILDTHNIEKYTRLYFHRQASTTMRSSAIPTTTPSPKISTVPMKIYKPRIFNFSPTEKEITTTERNENSVTKSHNDKTTLPIVESYEENDYDTIRNHNVTTVQPRTILDDLEKLDVHANELLKGTLVPKNSTKKNDTFEVSSNVEAKKEEKKKPHIEQVQQGTLKENTNYNFTQNDLNSDNIMLTYIKLGNFLQETDPHTSKKSTMESNDKSPEINTDKSPEIKNYTKTQDKRQNDKKAEPGETLRDMLNQSDSEEDNVRLNEGDIQDQEVLNEAVDIITRPMKRFNKDKSNKDKSLLPNYQFAAGTGLDIDSNTFNYRPSMIPENRPTYLEIDRNGWQDNNDYGIGDNIPYELN